MSHVVDVADLDGTRALGRRVAQRLAPGVTLALVGPLGAGKTHFVQAIAEALDVPEGVVNSPTFVLIQEYEGRLPLYHFDAYRLASEAEFADLGAHEYFASDGVCLVEWADKALGCLPADRIEVRIAPTGETSRRFAFDATGPRSQAIVDGLREGDA